MVSSEPDPDGFQPVITSTSTKKAKTTPTGAPRKKPEIETEIRATFKIPQKHHGDFNPTQRMKQMIAEMRKYDATIAIHALEGDEEALYPQYDKFPTKENEFEQYFFIHPIPNRPIYRNQITIGCRMLSTRTINDIKKATNDTTTMMEWLKKNDAYIEVDSLGRQTIRTLGYLFFLHPNMTHHVSLKGTISEALKVVTITKEEVEEIDPSATTFFRFTEGEDDDERIMEADDENAADNDDRSKLLNIPFEIFHTGVGYGIGTKRVATKALAIKCNVANGKILHELLIRMNIDKSIFPAMQFVPVGMATTMGPEPYKHLIRQNNAYLSTLATIPVIGFNNTTLEFTIPVNNGAPGAKLSIREILMSTDWCTQIEPTQTPGRMLLITTKQNLDTGRQWLDNNLDSIFQVYLPKNPEYIPDNVNPIPHRADIRTPNAKLDSYVEALCQHIILPVPTNDNNTTHTRPPPHRAPQTITVSYTQAAQKNTQTSHNVEAQAQKKRKARNSETMSTTSDHSNETTHTQNTITTVANLKQEVITTLRQEIAQIIQTDIQNIQADITNI